MQTRTAHLPLWIDHPHAANEVTPEKKRRHTVLNTIVHLEGGRLFIETVSSPLVFCHVLQTRPDNTKMQNKTKNTEQHPPRPPFQITPYPLPLPQDR